MLLAASDRLARLHYQPAGFRVLTNGDHVLCGVTGQKIALDNLRYWSVERQEAYASASIATEAMLAALRK